MHITVATPSNDTVFKVENATADWGKFCWNRSYDEVSKDELNVDIDYLHPLIFTPRSRSWTPFGIEGNFNISVKMEDNSTHPVSHVWYDYGFWDSEATLVVLQADLESDYSCNHVGSFVIQCDKMVAKNETEIE
ncbi:hypothetical protein V9T40_002741 [Parthenolecanium corni]|uniref:Uncharacterized protein n=1 Tax=Parthenolecanium corni TaxID=536013 RepID=A0AAN9TLB2_9HEMI